MAERISGQRSVTLLWVVVGLIGVLLCVSEANAKSSSASPATPAKAAPCDYHSRPSITTVTPNHAKPGQKITISGKNFGTKSCFHSVSFGPKSTEAWTYVNPTTVEATVPNLLPGSVPVTVSTEAGTSQFKLEVQAK
jgi:IPT/TIG domain-containing protein